MNVCAVGRRIFHRGGLKLHLWVLALLPLAALPVLAVILVLTGNVVAERLMQGKVESDLAVTHDHLLHVQSEVLSSVNSLANTARILELAMHSEPHVSLNDVLASRRQNLGFDFVAVLDESGKIIGAGDGVRSGEDYLDTPLVRAVLSGGQGMSGLEVVSVDTLRRLARGLDDQARLPLVDTPLAAPSSANLESRGLLILSAAPMPERAGRGRLFVVGGVLLNRNYGFVDYLAKIGSEGQLRSMGGGETVTLFLGDVRIATTVRGGMESAPWGAGFLRSSRNRCLTADRRG